jgi:hypothetical protein
LSSAAGAQAGQRFVIARQDVVLARQQIGLRRIAQRLAQIDAGGPHLIQKRPIAPLLRRAQGLGIVSFRHAPIDQQIERGHELRKVFGPLALGSHRGGTRRFDQLDCSAERFGSLLAMSQLALGAGGGQIGHEAEIGIGLHLFVDFERLAGQFGCPLGVAAPQRDLGQIGQAFGRQRGLPAALGELQRLPQRRLSRLQLSLAKMNHRPELQNQDSSRLLAQVVFLAKVLGLSRKLGRLAQVDRNRRRPTRMGLVLRQVQRSQGRVERHQSTLVVAGCRALHIQGVGAIAGRLAKLPLRFIEHGRIDQRRGQQLLCPTRGRSGPLAADIDRPSILVDGRLVASLRA